MSSKSSLPPTESIQPSQSSSRTFRSYAVGNHRQKSVAVGSVVAGFWGLVAAIATATQVSLIQSWERQTQTLFFEVRGQVAAPKDIIILAMDDTSMTQGTETYPLDPNQYSYFAPIQQWPWQRTAYAIVIDRLMQAGAKGVILDILLDAPSSYGPEDDQQLQAVLKKYPGRIGLAAKYEDRETREGSQSKLILPNPVFLKASPSVGFINVPLSPDGKIHELGREFPKLVAQTYPPELAKAFLEISAETPSFAEAALKAAQMPFSDPEGQNIFYYGPQGTFEQVPFWHILEPDNWKNLYLKNQTFKDKVVLVGATAGGSLQDFQSAPFSGTLRYPEKMAGVEVQANAVATLLENKSIAEAIPNDTWRGGAVFLIVMVAASLQTVVLVAIGYLKQHQNRLHPALVRFLLATGTVRLVMAVAIALTWGGISYAAFVNGRLILPTAVPILAIALSGVSYFISSSASDFRKRLQMVKILAQFPRSAVVQRILDEYVEFQDLLQEPEQAFFGEVLNNRYRITKVLGSGGFGRTYIAEDSKRPGNPLCVVKQLRPASDNANLVELAKRLFNSEASTLEKLGKHDQIPQLLAYFEEAGEFYLVQEFVAGRPLSSELPLGRRLPEARAITILREVLQILEFVHNQKVIHRDIKPSNIIRRDLDGKLVLIDFGAVKVSEHLEDNEQSAMTIGIGTKGYMPSEQSEGKPRPNSDIYALGMIGIQALTGLFPSQIREREDSRTGEIVWKERAQVSHALAEVLNKMVLYDYRKRYQTAADVLHDLNNLPSTSTSLPPLVEGEEDVFPVASDDPDESTQPWPQTFSSNSGEASSFESEEIFGRNSEEISNPDQLSEDSDEEQ